MYTLEVFSKMSGIPTQTIREYENAGLLCPADTDKEAGESLYTTSELVALHEITAFSQMGFAPSEIVDLLNSSQPELDLQRKKEQLTRKIHRISQRLTELDDYLLEAAECNVVIKSLPEITVAAKNVVAPSLYDFFPMMNTLYKELDSIRCKIAATDYQHIVIHGDKYAEKDFEVELCVAVDGAKADTDTIKFKTIPAVSKAACSYHKDSYDTLHLTHTFSALWMDYNGYVIDGEFREIYIDGQWNKNSEDEWLTEVQVPLKPISEI